LWGESSLAERFNDIGRKLLSPAYDPKSDRHPTVDEALDAEKLPEDKEPVTAKTQPKNTELAALEQNVQKSAKQSILIILIPTVISLSVNPIHCGYTPLWSVALHCHSGVCFVNVF